MSSAAALRDLAETLDDPRSETLLHVAREVEDVVDALMAAESALDHARRTADPETAIVLHGAQLRAQRAIQRTEGAAIRRA
jgi:hypothetical protein